MRTNVDKERYIKLTLAVYKVSELFPENETLKWDIRSLADEILANLINNQGEKISRLIENIKSLFNEVEARNWVDSRNFLVLRKEYDRIEKSIENEPVFSGKPVENSQSAQERKEKILEFLEEKRKVQLRELAQTFPQVSKRTLIRDLDELYQAGVVVKMGNGRASSYNFKS